jgi:hypothetical protein
MPRSSAAKRAALVSPLQFTNGVEWKDGQPVALKDVKRPAVRSTIIFEPRETDWKYSHHQSVTVFKKRLYAIWSSSLKDEDTPGQRVMYAVRSEIGEWSRPRVLFQPEIDPDGTLRVLTAAGFNVHGNTLVAYAGDYADNRKTTRLFARTSTTGERWSDVIEIKMPVCPNHGPQRISSGRLIIAGNTAWPYTDDPLGLKGWKLAGIATDAIKPFHDNPTTFWEVCKNKKWANLCEGSLHETDDGVLWMLMRSTSLDKSAESLLWETRSVDQGVTWSTPRKTAFSNTDAKFHFGRLPDGRYYSIGNPLNTGIIRMPLVLSTSNDGLRFDRHYIVGEKPYLKRFEGAFKGGEYSYPHTVLDKKHLYVIVARQKEAIELIEVPLSELT